MSWRCEVCSALNKDPNSTECFDCHSPKPSTPVVSSSFVSPAASANPFMFGSPAASSSFGSPAAYVSSYVPGAASAAMFPAAASSPGASTVPSCRTKAYFIAESDKVTAVCNIPRRELEAIFHRAKFVEDAELSEEQQFTREMFGYDAGTQRKYDALFPGGKAVLGISNFPLNEAYRYYKENGRPYHYPPDQADADQMGRIFETVIREKTFETKKIGIVFRAWTEGIETVSKICNGESIGRYTSTSVRKEYSDTWGIKPQVGTMKPNSKGFFATIIIPANTTSIIPLLLFNDLPLKTSQYEVLLHPEGRLIDTGYNDTAGYRVIVYLGPEKSALFGAPLPVILSLSDPSGTNVKGLIESHAISQPGNPATHGGRKRKTRRYKRSKRKTKK